MTSKITGYILFNKKNINFVNANNEDTEIMHEAYVYTNKKSLIKELNEEFDEPDDYDIWAIEVCYNTIQEGDEG